MMYNSAKQLEQILENCGNSNNKIIDRDKKIIESFEKSNQNLEKIFSEIDKIKVESLKAAVNEDFVLNKI